MSTVWRVFTLIALGLLSGCSSAPPILPPGPEPALPPRATIGYSLREVTTNNVLLELEASRAFVPASVTKLFTAMHALSQLGEKHTFKTRIWMDGKVERGILRGALILEGGGDPYLTARDLMAMAYRLKLAGLQRVEGGALYDESLYGQVSQIRTDTDAFKPFNPGVSALSVEFNQAALVEKKGARFVLPSTWAGNFPKDTHAFSSEDGENDGEKRARFSVQDPGKYTADLFREFAAFVGIEIPAFQKGRKRGRVVVTHESPPLRQIVDGMLEHSNNLVAELLGLAATRRPGASIESSGRALSLWMDRQSGSKANRTLSFSNASGLTRNNLVSANAATSALVEFLKRTRREDEPLLARLPIGGWKGTLSNRFRDPNLAFRIWAKTGTLEYVSALAGYFFSKSGKTIAFSLFIQDDSPETKLDLDEKSWRRRALKLQESLLSDWVKSF